MEEVWKSWKVGQTGVGGIYDAGGWLQPRKGVGQRQICRLAKGGESIESQEDDGSLFGSTPIQACWKKFVLDTGGDTGSLGSAETMPAAEEQEYRYDMSEEEIVRVEGTLLRDAAVKHYLEVALERFCLRWKNCSRDGDLNEQWVRLLWKVNIKWATTWQEYWDWEADEVPECVDEKYVQDVRRSKLGGENADRTG